MTGKVIIWTGAKAQTLNEIVGPNLLRHKVPNVCTQYIEPKLVGYETTKKGEQKRIEKHFVPKVPKGFVCLAMGAKCVESLKQRSIVPKNLGMGKLRETAHPAEDGGHFLVSYDPGIVAIDYARKPEIEWDVSLATRLLRTGDIAPLTGKYRYVDDFAFLVNYIEKQYADTGKPVRLACDLETVGLDAVNPEAYIVSVAFSPKKGTGFVRYFNNVDEYPQKRKGNMSLWVQLNWLLTSDKVKICGANFAFDWHWIQRHWNIVCTNWRLDSLLAGSLLDENRINALNMHAKIYVPDLGGYDDSFNKQHDKSQMQKVPKEDLLVYAGGDVDAGLQVADCIERELRRDKRLLTFYGRLLHPASMAFAAVQRRGMLVDIDRYEILRKDIQTEINEAHAFAISLLPPAIQAKYSDNLSLSREVILSEYLFSKRGLNITPRVLTAKAKKPSTAKSHLQLFENHKTAGPFMKALFTWKSATKTMSTYVVGFLKHLRADGRFHPSYMLHRGSFGEKEDDGGTVTGRTSAKDPAYQTIPKHTKWAKRLREVYVAPEGYIILNADFSQGELRIAACLAGEKKMIAAYKKGIDIHMLTGLALWNIQNPDQPYTLVAAMKLKKSGDERIKMIRQGGKAGNFGLLYGMQVNGFVAYAYHTYGVTLTHKEAEAFRDKFFEDYPNLLKWHDHYQALARRHGKIRSPLGRLRHLPLIHSRDWEVRSKAERQAVNSPVQATLSDLGLYVAGELWDKYPRLWLNGFTHDALTFYLPKNKATYWAQIIKHEMENIPFEKFGWKPELTFPVDLEIGYDLGHLDEVSVGEIDSWLQEA